jgi:hypothetical protein
MLILGRPSGLRASTGPLRTSGPGLVKTPMSCARGIPTPLRGAHSAYGSASEVAGMCRLVAACCTSNQLGESCQFCRRPLTYRVLPIDTWGGQDLRLSVRVRAAGLPDARAIGDDAGQRRRSSSADRATALAIANCVAVLGKHPIHRGAADTKRGRDCARRFTASMHPLGQTNFRLVERFRTSDVLTTRTARITGRGTALPAEFRQARENASHHPPNIEMPYHRLTEGSDFA